MKIYDIFAHKYPITNLHELDLSWLIELVDNLEATLIEWESIINELQEGLKSLDEINAKIDTINAEIADLDDIRNQLAIAVNDIENLKAAIERIDNDTDALYGLISSNFAILSERIDLSYERLHNQLELLKQAHNIDIEVLKVDINEKYNYLLDLINQVRPVDVFNRVAGKRLSFDDNNFNIYEDLRYFGITNNTLYELSGNNEVASLVHNNRDYALFMKLRMKKNYIYSPLSGKKVSHNNAISELAAITLGGISNADYYNYMLANGLTNDDIGDVYDDNVSRFKLIV